MLLSASRIRFVAPARFVALLVLLVFSLLLTSSATITAPPFVEFPPAAPPAVVPHLGTLPLSFVPNVGQSHPDVLFQSQGMGGTIFFTADEVVLSLPTAAAAHPPADTSPERPSVTQATHTTNPTTLLPDTIWDEYTQSETQTPAPSIVRLHFLGANPQPEVQAGSTLPGVVSYFLGNDPDSWHTDISTHQGIVYRHLYDGIDLHYDGTEGTLKGTYTVAPGRDPGRIRWRYQGADHLAIDPATGDLRIRLPDGSELIEHAPTAFQEIDGAEVPVAIRYTLLDDGTVGFVVGAYDADATLVIDPELVWSTFIGSNGTDYAYGVAVDDTGNIYVTGKIASRDLPTIPGPEQTSTSSLYVWKVNATGTALVYGTYLGGISTGRSIAVDDIGNAYVTGHVAGIAGYSDFPTTPGAFDTTWNGNADAFIFKLNASGTDLIYSTFLGSSEEDLGMRIAINNAGDAYVTGYTVSANTGYTISPKFPTTPGAFDTILNSVEETTDPYPRSDSFVVRLKADGSELVYSTFLGGSKDDRGYSIAVDRNDNAYVVGSTGSSDFPTTAGAFDTSGGGAYVTKLNASGTDLIYSTFIGGGAVGHDIALDEAGYAYITGSIRSSDFPVTPGAFDTTLNGLADVFVAKLNTTGTNLIYATLLGGRKIDEGYAIAIDDLHQVYVTGRTDSLDFPTTSGAFDETKDTPDMDCFVAKLNAEGSHLIYSTYIGGEDSERIQDIAIDKAGYAYITGYTDSDTFPTTEGVLAEQLENSNGFLFKILPGVKSWMTPLPVVSHQDTIALEWAASGASSFDVQVRAGPTGAWEDLLVDTTQTSTIFTGASGTTYYFRVRARNGLGTLEMRSTEYDTVTLIDNEPPAGTIRIADGAPAISSRSVPLTLSATDGASGVSEMRFSNDGATWDDWQPYAESANWFLPGNDGEQTVAAQFRDQAGNISATAQDTILLDQQAPASAMHALPATSSSALALEWSGTDDRSGIASYDVQVHTGGSGLWQDLLVGTTTTRMVYAGEVGITYYFRVRARDVAGNVEAWPSIYDAATLVSEEPPAGTISIADGAAATASREVTLLTDANDEVSPITRMRFSNDGEQWSVWHPYAATADWSLSDGDGQKTVFVQFKDALDTVSPTSSDTILLDQTPPSGSITINDANPTTTSRSVGLRIAASDTGTSVTAMRITATPDTATDDEWIASTPDQTTYLWTLPDQDGQQSVFVQFRDAVGNVSAPLHDTIRLDRIAPTASIAAQLIPDEQAVKLAWSGSDAGSGIAHYDVQVRVNDAPVWEDVAVRTTATYTTTPLTQVGTYAFRVRAHDTAGNRGAWSADETRITVDAATLGDTSGLPKVQFSAESLRVNEYDGTLSVIVLLSAPVSRTVTVESVTRDDTAIEGHDYTRQRNRLIFAPHETATVFNLPITDDREIEANETFTVTLRDPTGATLGTPASLTVTILDDDGGHDPNGDAYEPDNTCGAASAIATDGTTQEHTLHRVEEQDWITFDAIEGTTYYIVATVPPNSPANLHVELFTHCDGSLVDEQNYAFSPGVRLEVEAPTSGPVFIKVTNDPPTIAGPQVSYTLAVRTRRENPSPGALIIVAGQMEHDDPVQAHINHVASSVYRLFQELGYPKDRIAYLAPDLTLDADGDGTSDVTAAATNANLAETITTWAADKVSPERPLTLYLVDHGKYDKLYLDKPAGEILDPADLDTWLTTLERTTAITPTDERDTTEVAVIPAARSNIIIESCNAGSFIDLPRTMSQAGRVVIASTDPLNNAYASQRGAVFSDHFLDALRQGENMCTSFRTARWATTTLHPDQRPWIDGNGNGTANEPEDEACRGDGLLWQPEEVWPPYIETVTRTGTLNPGEAVLRAHVLDDTAVQFVWAVIYPPSYAAPTDAEGLVIEPLPTIALLHQTDDWYAASYPGFDEPGTYRVVVRAQDEEGMEAQPVALEIQVGPGGTIGSSPFPVFLPLVRGVKTFV